MNEELEKRIARIEELLVALLDADRSGDRNDQEIAESLGTKFLIEVGGYDFGQKD